MIDIRNLFRRHRNFIILSMWCTCRVIGKTMKSYHKNFKVWHYAIYNVVHNDRSQTKWRCLLFLETPKWFEKQVNRPCKELRKNSKLMKEKFLRKILPVLPCHLLQPTFKLLKKRSSLKVLFVVCWFNKICFQNT